jgi:hypothetical protein
LAAKAAPWAVLRLAVLRLAVLRLAVLRLAVLAARHSVSFARAASAARAS